MTPRLLIFHRRILFIVLALAALPVGDTLAAPGDLNTTFGTGGTARIHTGFGDDFGNAMLPLTGGGYLVAGSTQEADRSGFFVAQYLGSGALSTSFGNGGVGRIIAPPEFSSGGATSLALQGDGRIVVAGSCSSTPAVARFLSNGAPDSTFGMNGLLLLNGMTTASIAGVVIQGTRIVIGGGFRSGTVYHFGLIRLNGDGTFDTTFDGDGIVSTPILLESFADALLLQSDGKFVLAGNAKNTSLKKEVAVARYNADGTLDTGFSGDGKATFAVGPGGSYAYALVNQGTKLIVAGATQSTSSGPFNALLIRYNADGSLDPTFGPQSGTGILIQPVGAQDDIFDAVTITYSSRGNINGIVAAGSTAATTGNTSDILVCRYLLTGALDTAFDGDGIAITATSNRQEQARGIAILDSKILLAGYTGFGGSDPDVVLLRYVLANGALDPTLDGDGIRIHDIGDEYAAATSVGVASDGKVILSGTLGTNPSRVAVVRLTPVGTMDTTYGVNGIALFSVAGYGTSAADHVIQPDGRLLVVGSTSASASSASLALRLMPNGTLDTSFATVGYRQWGLTGFNQATGVALRPDGRSVVVGFTTAAGGQIFVGGFDAAGVPDLALGGFNGLYLQPGGFPASANDVALQPDGKIVIVGSQAPTGGSNRILVMRLTATGALDPTFNGTGFVTVDVSPQSDYGTAVAILADGKIVVSGNHGVTSSTSGTCLLRYDAAGHPDATLDGDGVLVRPINTERVSVNAMLGTPAGNFLEAGVVSPAGVSSYDQRILGCRYDGVTDFGWSGDGTLTLDFASTADQATDLALTPDGEVLVAGQAGGLFAVTRLQGGFAASAVEDAAPRPPSEVGPAWPNPTPLGATVAFTVPAPMLASAAVFDVTGRLVRRLVTDTVMPEGNQSVVWDGRDESGAAAGRGVYFIRLRLGDQVAARRVVVTP